MRLESLLSKQILDINRFLNFFKIVKLLDLVNILMIVRIFEHFTRIQLYEYVPCHVVSKVS